MSWRHQVLSEFSTEIVWLNDAQAFDACDRAWECLGRTDYGLNIQLFPTIDRLDVERAEAEAHEWLSQRIGSGNDRLFVVFDEADACTLDPCFFINHWRELFLPSRDDVVILPPHERWALYYCHEDEFQFGLRS